MYCIHCGQELPDNANFCSNCGKQVNVTFSFATQEFSEPIKETPKPEPPTQKETTVNSLPEEDLNDDGTNLLILEVLDPETGYYNFGFQDEDENVIIEPKYCEVKEFQNGLAPVMIHWLWGIYQP